MPLKKSERIEVPVTLEYSSNLSHYLKRTPGVKVVAKSDKVQTEDQVVVECKKYLQSKGWITKTIYTGGIPTASGRYAENPAKGIPDCVAFHPPTKRMIWIEYKKSKGGMISQEQEAWHLLLKTCKQEIFVINSKKLLEEVLNDTTNSSIP